MTEQPQQQRHQQQGLVVMSDDCLSEPEEVEAPRTTSASPIRDRSASFGALYDLDVLEEEADALQLLLNKEDPLLIHSADPLAGTSPSSSLSKGTIICILSTAFSYGCIFSTLFLITLPIECERIQHEHPNYPKSVSLGIFVAIAGITQLISPLVGRLSDMYVPPTPHELGQRLPYLVLGSVCTVVGLMGQMVASYWGFWVRYSAFFFLHMIGLNIMYAMMLALLPDQVPKEQTGIANGILALELVLGSLFAFGLFYSFLYQEIQSMYALYTCIVIISTIATCTHAHDRDAALAFHRISHKRQRLKQQQQSHHGTIDGDNNNNKMVPSERDHLLATPPLSRQQQWKRAAQAANKAAKKAKQVLVVTPTIILKSLLVGPFRALDWAAFLQSYTIDTKLYHNFFVVTVSRLFYYSGMSIQTFFLYYVRDVLHVTQDPESVLAGLAILGQVSAAFTCYPVGVLSDLYLEGRRRPLVYLACAILLGASLSLVFLTELHQMTVVVLILGAANGMYLTMDTSLAVDTLPADLDDSAQLLGVWGVAAFLGSAMGPMIGGPLLYLFGRKTLSTDDGVPGDDATTTEEDGTDGESYARRGYVVVLSLGSFYFLISAVVLCFIRIENR